MADNEDAVATNTTSFGGNELESVNRPNLADAELPVVGVAIGIVAGRSNSDAPTNSNTDLRRVHAIEKPKDALATDTEGEARCDDDRKVPSHQPVPIENAVMGSSDGAPSIPDARQDTGSSCSIAAAIGGPACVRPPEFGTPYRADKGCSGRRARMSRQDSSSSSSCSREAISPSLLQNIVTSRMDADDYRYIVEQESREDALASKLAANSGRGSKHDSQRTVTSSDSRQFKSNAALGSKPGPMDVSFSDLNVRIETVNMESGSPAMPPSESAVISGYDIANGEPTTSAQNDSVITAFHVDQGAVEEQIRKRILREAVEAEEVLENDGKIEGPPIKWLVCILALLAVLVVGATAMVFVASNKNSTKSSEEDGEGNLTAATITPTIEPAVSTLHVVKERGVVRCGVETDIPGFGSPNNVTGELEGINIDQCRAIAVAVFGTPDKFELVKVVSQDRFTKLVNREVDVLSSPITRTMARQVFEESSKSGLVFTVPYFYSGMVFGGVPNYTACAEDLDTFTGICRLMKVCVIEDTTHEALLQQWFPGGFVVPVASMEKMIYSFANGICTVIATDFTHISFSDMQEAGYDGPYQKGEKMFSREPLSLCTRPDDPEWSNMVEMVVNVFFWAEAHNISKDNFEDIPSLVDPDSAKDVVPLMQAIVSKFGNYDDLYQSHLDQFVPRSGMNLLYGKHGVQTSGGLLYSYPFGLTEIRGMGPIHGQTMDRILARGYLHCGIASVEYDGYPGYPQMINDDWFGLDVTFCRALAAALFTGDADAVDFVVVDHDWVLGARSLEDGSVDVVAGALVSLRADYRGYSFSPPYYYHHENNSSMLKALALMTLDKDTMWSSFVFWTVMAMVYAEEKGIGPESIAEMPIVNLFGEGQKQMFRDCVFAFGTYADIYNKTLPNVPRAGANLLNKGPMYGPQHFAVPL